MIVAHSGSQGQTGVMIVSVLSLLGPGKLFLINSIAIPAIAEPIFFSLSSAPGRKVGPGFCPETALEAACRKPNALLAPPVGG